MRKLALKAAFLSSAVAVVCAVTATASAAPSLRRLRNADTTHGQFFLGIPGGVQNGHVGNNLNLVVWQASQNDQFWWVPLDNGYGQFSDFYTNVFGQAVCLTVNGSGNGAPIADQACDPSANNTNQLFQLIGSNKVGKDALYPGCYILWNPTTSKAIGVANKNVTNGGAVVQWDYDGTANQFWCPN